MRVGLGYDLLTGTQLTSPAVQGNVSAIPDAHGQNVISSFIRIDDLDTLHQTLGVSVDAGGSYFGVGGDVKVDYAKECNMSRFSTHVMVRVSVEDPFESFDAPELAPDAKTLLQNTGDLQSTRFRERFGDVFIDGIQKGGEYFATWEIVSVDQSVRETIATKVEAGFNDLLVAAHLDVDVKTATETTSSHVEVHVHVMQQGSIDHTDQTMAEILQKAHDFPPSVAGNNAAAFAVSLADYKTLNLPNDAFNFLNIQNQRDVLAEHARKRFDFLALRNSISYIRQHPQDFVGADDTVLGSQLAKVTEAINKMETEASACLNDAKKCNFTPFDVSDFPLPPPKPGQPSSALGPAAVFQHTTTYNGQNFTSNWSLASTDTGVYHAQEIGLGNASGSAVLNGLHLRISWATAPEQGTYEWDLDATLTQGDGVLTFTIGSRAGTKSTASHVVRIQ
jgi:hypothetical protein